MCFPYTFINIYLWRFWWLILLLLHDACTYDKYTYLHCFLKVLNDKLFVCERTINIYIPLLRSIWFVGSILYLVELVINFWPLLFCTLKIGYLGFVSKYQTGKLFNGNLMGRSFFPQTTHRCVPLVQSIHYRTHIYEHTHSLANTIAMVFLLSDGIFCEFLSQFSRDSHEFTSDLQSQQNVYDDGKTTISNGTC